MTVDSRRKAVLFAPFWRQEGHVGKYRVDRFVRWLANEGYTVIIIRAGMADEECHQPWGREIAVRDQFALYRDVPPEPAYRGSPRKASALARAAGKWVLIPDSTVVWARAAAKRPSVVEAMRGAAFILSSSPPESAHLGAWLLSRRTAVPHIVDMRDGWLDEPLKPLLRTSALHRWLEGRMEARILRDAKSIQVTSDVWKSLLCARFPGFAPKVHVLTNGYPKSTTFLQSKPPQGSRDGLLMIHAGRFTDSDSRRTPDLLLQPLLHNLTGQSSAGVVRLIGALSENESAVIGSFRPRFERIGWRIECSGLLPRSEVLALLPKADGLLLVSASRAALPSKLFEYIPTGRPLFVVTGKGSATWNVCAQLPQATLVEIGASGLGSDLIHETPCYEKGEFRIPPEYREECLAKTFTNMIQS